MASKYGKEIKDILFISDIRTASPYNKSEEENEELVIKDTEEMVHWCRLMRPKMSYLIQKKNY